MRNEVMILTGPTASGKSARAVQYALARGGVVINADSMQLYRNAPILTAQPSAAEIAAVPHRLYGMLDVSESGSVAHWLALACTEIRATWEKQLLPIVTGGTGMYLQALMQGLSPVPEISEAIRAEVRAIAAPELYPLLCAEDPEIAAQLRPTDQQRMGRALEVIRATGRSLLAWQKGAPQPPLPEASFTVEVLQIERAVLYERINRRTEALVAGGGLQEAAALHTRNLPRSLPLMRAVGVKELLDHLDGSCTLEEAIAQIQTNTRRYAKRQLTWIRHHYF